MDDGNVIDLKTRVKRKGSTTKSTLPEKAGDTKPFRLALDDLPAMMKDLQEGGHKYNKAVLIVVADHPDDPGPAGYKVGVIGTGGFDAIGILETSKLSLVSALGNG